MIENERTNELRGQMELGDVIPAKAEAVAEGYDEEGHLLNMDYPPIQKPSPVGEGVSASALTDEVFDAADMGEVGENAGKAGVVPATRTSSVTAKAVPPSPEGKAFGEAEVVPATRTSSGAIVPPSPKGKALGAQTSADRLTALATEINAITEQTRGVVISGALAVGKRLIEARSLCPEGRFGEWLAASVNYSERKAQDLMRLYQEYGRDGVLPESIAALDYSKAVALLSAPAEAREALAERASAEELSVRQLQQEIKRLNAEHVKAQMQIDSYIDQTDKLREEIAHLDDREQEYDRAIVERDDKIKAAQAAIQREREAATLANAKAAAAEASAQEMRKLHSDAEDRAAKSAQRASDAVNRANQVAKDLAEARAKIAALSEAAAAAVEPERVEVEVIPEETRREIEQLKRELAEARALQKPSPVALKDSLRVEEGGPRSGSDEVSAPSATEKFKWFYGNQMKPTFTTALNLLKEVAQEDGKAADAFATAITNACKVLMNQLGTKAE